ncbi:MAG: IS66 family transposase [Planctomycetes bacterium]|nr:IS66 family transposase [Planctomycetota bacterium]
MSEPKTRIELPPEAEPARDFIEALVARYEKRIHELEQQVQSLTQQLQKLTPRNSSLPPSTEHPHAKPERKKQSGKKRKQGGQKGHKRHQRDLVPVEDCTTVTPCYPSVCRRCGGELKADASPPRRHQVWELPEIKPIIDEYQLHRGHCSCCGMTTQAELPEGVPSGQCGPRLAAFTGLLMGHYRQSKRRTAAFLGDLLNIPCSPAWTVKIQNLVSAAVAAPYEQLRGELTKQKQLFVDESPTKENKQKAWLWVAVAQTFAVFGIFANRSRESLVALVGNYQGIILNCDRARMYLDGKRLQWCWAHLKRDFQKLIDSPNGQEKRMGHNLMRQHRQLFEYWREYKAGKIKWSTFQSKVAPIREQVGHLLLRGIYSGNAKLIGFCNELYPGREHLWTFTRVEGIEPTNNTAERALRPAVIYRKLSFGTQSASGSRFLERLLTVSETCRLQNRNAYQYLIEAMQAQFAGHPAPSLLPPSPAITAAAA